mmetsp:Transcript_26611/g.30435  ORF Transcript_26611/g.30435 Transcript_26611/m.30435 type:complete len:92 (-) Transcript_26611:2863-3138(-)
MVTVKNQITIFSSIEKNKIFNDLYRQAMKMKLQFFLSYTMQLLLVVLNFAIERRQYWNASCLPNLYKERNPPADILELDLYLHMISKVLSL